MLKKIGAVAAILVGLTGPAVAQTCQAVGQLTQLYLVMAEGQRTGGLLTRETFDDLGAANRQINRRSIEAALAASVLSDAIDDILAPLDVAAAMRPARAGGTVIIERLSSDRLSGQLSLAMSQMARVDCSPGGRDTDARGVGAILLGIAGRLVGGDPLAAKEMANSVATFAVLVIVLATGIAVAAVRARMLRWIPCNYPVTLTFAADRSQNAQSVPGHIMSLSRKGARLRFDDQIVRQLRTNPTLTIGASKYSLIISQRTDHTLQGSLTPTLSSRDMRLALDSRTAMAAPALRTT